jgi:DNA-binding CsgD family transcriptional regulator
MLNSREREILSFILLGLSTKEISSVLHLKLREIEMHRYNIKLKLNIRTNKELISQMHILYKSVSVFIEGNNHLPPQIVVGKFLNRVPNPNK